jgi:hypothetical protein
VASSKQQLALVKRPRNFSVSISHSFWMRWHRVNGSNVVAKVAEAQLGARVVDKREFDQRLVQFETANLTA